MPTLRILTNVRLADEDRGELLRRASAAVAAMLRKPESYVMVIMEDGRDLLFAGSDDPTAYLELKSLGLPESETAHYSSALCELLQDALGVAPARVYIEFVAPPRHLFGWDGGTF
jgi:phenylpyruvate tautomerase PptA (4-oxalocrotonate tautomerase family)